MSSDDISNLFRQFGGRPADYQEVGKDNSARRAQGRWPLLAAVDIGGPAPSIAPVAPADNAAPLATLATLAAPRRLAEWMTKKPAVESVPSVEPSMRSPALSAPQPVAAAPPSALAANGPAFPADVERPVFHAPAAAPAEAPTTDDLQGIFRRLAAPPASAPVAPPAAAPADSLLRRLLRL